MLDLALLPLGVLNLAIVILQDKFLGTSVRLIYLGVSGWHWNCLRRGGGCAGVSSTIWCCEWVVCDLIKIEKGFGD